jgi:hypothetical protein
MSDAATNVLPMQSPRGAGGGTGGGGGGSMSGGGSGGSDGLVTWKDYVDAQDGQTRAQNDARFAEVISRLDSLRDLPRFWPLVVSGIVIMTGAIGIVFTVLSYASDRFDGGIAASGLLDTLQQEQEQRDAAQDAKLDQILEAVRAQPQPSEP